MEPAKFSKKQKKNKQDTFKDCEFIKIALKLSYNGKDYSVYIIF